MDNSPKKYIMIKIVLYTKNISFTHQLILFQCFHVGRISKIHGRIDVDKFSPKYSCYHRILIHMGVGLLVNGIGTYRNLMKFVLKKRVCVL